MCQTRSTLVSVISQKGVDTGTGSGGAQSAWHLYTTRFKSTYLLLPGLSILLIFIEFRWHQKLQHRLLLLAQQRQRCWRSLGVESTVAALAIRFAALRCSTNL